MPAPDDAVEAAKADVEQTREALQETVDQLTERLDPRVRAREAGESVKATAAEGLQSVTRNPVPVAGVAAAVVALVVGVVVWRRRAGGGHAVAHPAGGHSPGGRSPGGRGGSHPPVSWRHAGRRGARRR